MKVKPINDQIIEKVNQIKYLGFIAEKNLKFRNHIYHICKKIGKKISFFKRTRNQVSILTAVNKYMQYKEKVSIERLHKLQNRHIHNWPLQPFTQDY